MLENTQGVSVRTKLSERLSTASADDFIFRVSKDRVLGGEETEISLTSLRELAKNLFTLYTSTRPLLSAFAFLRDNMVVEDVALIAKLNALLWHTICSGAQSAVHLYFGDDDERNVEDIQSFAFGEDDPVHTSDVFGYVAENAQQLTLDSEVTIKFLGRERCTGALSEFLTTGPLRLLESGEYYWHHDGEWKSLSKTTVERRRQELGKTLIADALGFPSFNPAQDRVARGDTTVASENAYNDRVYQEFKRKGEDVYLFDCDNIQVGGGQKYEFADLLLARGGEYFLVHVKRGFEGSTLSHLFAQAAMSAEFLKHDFETSGRVLEKIGKAITSQLLKGTALRGRTESMEDLVEEAEKQLRDVTRELDNTRSQRRKVVLETQQKEKQKNLDELKQKQSELAQKLSEFKHVFPNDGVLRQEDAQKIHIVLAMIDETGTGQGLDNLTYFNVEHLSRTQKSIEGNFLFHTMVIPTA